LIFYSSDQPELPQFFALSRLKITFKLWNFSFLLHKSRFTMASNGDFKLYRYDPSVPLAAVASVLFALLTSLHLFQMYRSRVWFLIPLVLGGICQLTHFLSFPQPHIISNNRIVEVIGFAARAYNASQTPDWALGPYIIQSVLLLVAPALFAGSIYMILGRIILMTDGEKHSIVKRKWLTKLFVLGDILAFTVQAGGSFFENQQ